MFCYNCGTEIPNESTFCGRCGCELQENQGLKQVNQNTQQMYNNQYLQQYAGAPVSHKTRNIIIISSVAAALAITLTIVLILALGNKSFIGSWKFSGFIDENYEFIDFDEFAEIAEPQKVEEVSREFDGAVLVINDDGTAQITEAGRTADLRWQAIGEKNIMIEELILTLEKGYLSIYAGRSFLDIRKKDGSGELELIGLYFE